MKEKLGIMQGRLTNKDGFFPQQFPWENWEEEFRIAKENHIDYIEWMFNTENFCENPVWTKAGRKRIREVILASGVGVHSICANYFMQNGLRMDKKGDVCRHLIEAAEELEISHIILPLFEESMIADPQELYELLEPMKEWLQGTKVSIALESDFLIERQIDICQLLSSPKIGICYDVGNGAGNGRDYVKDIAESRRYLLEVHLKDKKYKGSSVMLGKGTVNFEEVFRALKDWTSGCFILESYFGKDAVQDTLKNIQYVRRVRYA